MGSKERMGKVMEFNIKRDLFSVGIQKTLGIVEKKTTMPILSNLLLRAGQNRITIMATDREIGLVADYEAEERRSMLLKMKGMLSF
jgi:DNA polymerase III subunit beta